jgi:2-polyprenyl-3-methyl-5-hydroxy-6-metoxy-1,4-benzoquinol methylase
MSDHGAGTARPDTSHSHYAERLARLEGARWKQVLDVQRPYRWNLQRLGLGRTLDVGCGLGRNLAGLEDGVGVDHNPDSVAIARDRGLRAWTTDEWPTCADAVASSFDTMLVAHVLEHLDEATADAVLTSYLPYLKPDATLVLICPQEKGYATDHTHVRFVDDQALRATARRLGFSPVRQYSFPFPRATGKVFPYNEFVLTAQRLP